MALRALRRCAALLSLPLGPAAAAGSETTAGLRGRSSAAGSGSAPTAYRSISEHELRDKIEGYWVGQLVGNFMGLPFEFVYMDEPMPFLPDTYYDEQSANASGVRCNHDGRGSIPSRLNELQGAYTDDDTDIEFVTLHAVLDHGLDLSYPEIAEYWKKYVHITINGSEALWFANRRARELMDAGLLPPQTGSKENNTWWWTIDPQLVNEIWSAFYPGMIEEAVDRAEWGARITSSSWGTHPTRFYAALYSAGFFHSDVFTLYDIAMHFVPEESPFRQGLVDVRNWYSSDQAHDWRSTWSKIRDRYFHYPDTCGGEHWSTCYVSSMINGLLGAMALLYGGGDFMRTVGIAIAAGFDCDNQAATLAGLLGVVHGSSKIPRSLTHNIAGNRWAKPFNDRYVNERRPPLPRMHSNADIVAKIMRVTHRAILENGGSVGSEESPAEVEGQIYRISVSRMLSEKA